MPYFQTKQFVTALSLMSHIGGELPDWNIQNALFSKQRTLLI